MPRTGTYSSVPAVTPWTVHEGGGPHDGNDVYADGGRWPRVMRGALDAIEDAVALLDLQGRIHHANQGLEILVGRGGDQLLGQLVDELFHDATSESVRNAALGTDFDTCAPLPWDALWDHGVWRGARRLRRVDGTPVAVEVTLRGLVEGDDTIAVAMVLRPQAAPVVRDSEPALARRICNVASSIAHDCNNHLSVILNYTYIMGKQLKADSTLREHVEEMQASAWHAAQLTERLLDVARQHTRPARGLDLNQAIQDVAALLQETMGRDIQLHTQLAPQLWPVDLHVNTLHQVLINLSIAARDRLNGRGAIEITTHMRSVDQPIPSAGAPVAKGDYSVVEVKHWGRRHRTVTGTQKILRGSTVGPGIVFESITAAGGYVVYEDDEIYVARIFFPAATVISSSSSA